MTFRKVWAYSVIGDESLDMDEILKCIPPCMSFVKTSPSFTTQHNSIFGDYPMPNSDWTVAIFSTNDQNFHITNAIGLTYGQKCCMAWSPGDSTLVLGLRLWHEILHAMGADADGMVTTSRDAFTGWLVANHPDVAQPFVQNPQAHEHDPVYQKYFYLFISWKLSAGCEQPKLECTFDAEPMSGVAPLTVDFFDMTAGYPTSWEWIATPGPNPSCSNLPHCTHTFQNPGTYTVTLTVSNIYGSSTALKTITVALKKSPFQSFIAWLLRLLGG